MKNFIKSLKDMTKFEKIWLTVFSVIIVATTGYFSFLYTDYSDWSSIAINWFFSPISAITGVMCVLLAARGSYHTFSVGIINSLFYGIVAYKTGYYGDFLLNIFYFLPTQYFIWKYWKRNTINDKTDIVVMKKLTWKQILLLTVIGIIITVALGYLLNGVDHFAVNVMKRNVSIYTNIDKMFGFKLLGPMMDSSTEFLQIAAELLMIFRFAEQWILWILVDVITIAMWIAVIVTDPTSFAYSVPTLVMWIAFFINAIYGMSVWYKKGK